MFIVTAKIRAGGSVLPTKFWARHWRRSGCQIKHDMFGCRERLAWGEASAQVGSWHQPSSQQPPVSKTSSNYMQHISSRRITSALSSSKICSKTLPRKGRHPNVQTILALLSLAEETGSKQCRILRFGVRMAVQRLMQAL